MLWPNLHPEKQSDIEQFWQKHLDVLSSIKFKMNRWPGLVHSGRFFTYLSLLFSSPWILWDSKKGSESKWNGGWEKYKCLADWDANAVHAYYWESLDSDSALYLLSLERCMKHTMLSKHTYYHVLYIFYNMYYQISIYLIIFVYIR